MSSLLNGNPEQIPHFYGCPVKSDRIFCADSIFTFSDSNPDFSSGTVVFIVSDAGCIQHTLGRDHGRSIFIFVTVIYNGFDPGLNNGLGALITGKSET